MTERILLAILCLTSICLWLPALSQPDPPGSWVRPLRRQLLIFPNDRPEWLQVEDQGPATGRKHLRVTLPAGASLKNTVQFALMELSWFWRNHPEVQQIQLGMEFRSPHYDLPALSLSGTRDSTSIRWMTHGATGDYEMKMFWLDPAQATPPQLRARLQAENWGANQSDGLYVSTHESAFWNGHGSLNQYLMHPKRPPEKEVQLMLFQGANLDDTMVFPRRRGWLEANTLRHLWSLQASWHQRCQNGMFLDFHKLGKKPRFSGLPWDQEN